MYTTRHLRVSTFFYLTKSWCSTPVHVFISQVVIHCRFKIYLKMENSIQYCLNILSYIHKNMLYNNQFYTLHTYFAKSYLKRDYKNGTYPSGMWGCWESKSKMSKSLLEKWSGASPYPTTKWRIFYYVPLNTKFVILWWDRGLCRFIFRAKTLKFWI